jgi:hypothetical protein
MDDGLMSLPAHSIPGFAIPGFAIPGFAIPGFAIPEFEFQTAETRLRNLAADRARVDVGSMSLSNEEGAGKAGCPSAPMVRVQQKARGRTTGVAGSSRPSLRNGFTAYT